MDVMTEGPRLEQLLEHRDFLRALATRLVSDPGTQDDLVSDVIEEATLRPPRHEALRPWLARVLRNRAKNRRRDAARRHQRERAAARSEGLPSAAEVAQRFELAENLAEKVQQLPEPYREVILFRYYEDLAPPAIAESLGIPVDTVKSRLRRALAQLRHNLDREHGSREKWLTALTPLALPGIPTAAFNIALGGTVLMSTKTLASIVLIPVLGLLAWFAFNDPDTPTIDKHSLDSTAVASVPGPLADASEPNPPTAMETGKVHAQAARTRITNQVEIKIRGRCVDMEGSPIRDCEVRLSVSQGKSKRKVGSSAQKKRVRRIKVDPIRTGKDGRFEFRFQSLPHKVYSMTFRADRYAQLSGPIYGLEDGKLRDLGNIQMRPGALVTGRVVDNHGRGLPSITVAIRLSNDRFSELHDSAATFRPGLVWQTSTDEMGRFKINAALCSGSWEVHVNRQLISSGTFVVPEGKREFSLQIQVRRLDETKQIRGRIVDESGRAISGVEVLYHPRPPSGRVRYSNRSEKDGSFRLLRSRDDLGLPLRLRLSKKGFDTLNPGATFQWGQHDLRFVMTRGSGWSIRVIDAESRKAVEEYGVRIKPLGTGGISGASQIVQQKGNHKDGVLHIRSQSNGRYAIQVVTSRRGLESEWKLVDLPAHPSPHLVFELRRAVQQKLLVVSSAGEPIVGTQVELLEAEQGHPIDESTFVNRGNLIMLGTNQATLWTEGKTKANGILTLSGPSSRVLGLRILGPGHIPLYRNDIRLDPAGGVRRIQVQTGASVAGRIHPIAVLKELAQLGSRGRKAGAGMSGLSFKTGLKLKRLLPPTRLPRKWSDRLPIAKDGTFHITGIPPGSWVLQLAWIHRAKSMHAHQLDLEPLGNLRDGEERKLDIDISQYRPGTVETVVHWNGNPVSEGILRLITRKSRSARGFKDLTQVDLLLDDKGAFKQKLVPAAYDCLLNFDIHGESVLSLYPTRQTLRVTPGGKQQMRLDVLTAELDLRLQTGDEKPLPGVVPILIPEGGKRLFYLARTDAQGECSKRVPAGSLRLLVRPKHLATNTGMKKFRTLHGKDFNTAYERALIPVGRLDLAAGKTAERRTFTVPITAGY